MWWQADRLAGEALCRQTPALRRRCGLGLLVVVLDLLIAAPLAGRGGLYLLDYGDYPVGPHPRFAPSAFGFPPGITSRAPVDAVLYWIFQAIRWAPLHLLPFVAVAPVACVAFARIFPPGVSQHSVSQHGVSQHRGLAVGMATVLFTVNPFVYERMASGQVYVVMGYTLLPVLLALAVRPLGSLVATAALGGLVLTLAIALSVHYLYIAGLLLVIVVAGHLAFRQYRPVKAGAGIAGCGAVLNLYWLVPAAHATLTMRSPVTRLDLVAFRTAADPVVGLAVNVAGLYGFWRPGPPLVKDQVSGWPILLLAMLVVAGFGLWQLCARGGQAGRAVALSCAAAGIAGLLLAMGAQGPTGGVYSWLFEHLPGFKVMREADKFAALLALAYATCFGAGAGAIASPLTGKVSRVLCVCCLAAVPLGYGYTQLRGFDGYARATTYPVAWAAADRSMSQGATALALPWRAYFQVPWMGDRVVANPAQGYFDRPVISADDLEAGPITTETSNPRSRFLQFCLGEGSHLTEFGRLLAPLGIRYVILANVPGAQGYGWLARQHDLKRVFSARSIVVYANTEPVRAAYQPRLRLSVRDWGQVVALAQRAPLTDYLIRVAHARPGPLIAPAAIGTPRAPAVIKVAGSTPASATLDLPPAAWPVVLTYPAYPGWQLPGFSATAQFGVTTAFTGRPGTASRTRLTATYAPWRVIEGWDIAGLCLAMADIGLLALVLIRRRLRTPGPVACDNVPERREAGLGRQNDLGTVRIAGQDRRSGSRA